MRCSGDPRREAGGALRLCGAGWLPDGRSAGASDEDPASTAYGERCDSPGLNGRFSNTLVRLELQGRFGTEPTDQTIGRLSGGVIWLNFRIRTPATQSAATVDQRRTENWHSPSMSAGLMIRHAQGLKTSGAGGCSFIGSAKTTARCRPIVSMRRCGLGISNCRRSIIGEMRHVTFCLAARPAAECLCPRSDRSAARADAAPAVTLVAHDPYFQHLVHGRPPERRRAHGMDGQADSNLPHFCELMASRTR